MWADRTPLVPAGHSRPVGSYSPGLHLPPIQARSFIFVSGQVATDDAGQVLCPGDPGGQTRIVFDRIAAVLAQAGGGLDALVAVTIYVTDLSHFTAISAVRNEILGPSAPSSTLVEVSGLVERGCLVEISGIAVL